MESTRIRPGLRLSLQSRFGASCRDGAIISALVSSEGSPYPTQPSTDTAADDNYIVIFVTGRPDIARAPKPDTGA